MTIDPNKFMQEIKKRDEAELAKENISPLLKQLLKVQSEIEERATKPIEWTKPLLNLDVDHPVLYESSITVLQGAKASAKSKLGLLIVSMALKEDILVILADTEKSPNNRVPDALQSIKKWLGIPIEQLKIPNFHVLSLLDAKRDNERLDVISEYVALVNPERKPMIIVYDVSTDLLADPNDLTDVYRSIDIINQLCSQYNAAVLTTIHTNPSGANDKDPKPAHHLGTQLMNKAVVRVGIKFNKIDSCFDLRYYNTNEAALPQDLRFEYCDATKLLKIVKDDRPIFTIEDHCREVLQGFYPKVQFNTAAAELGKRIGTKTLKVNKDRIKDFIADETVTIDDVEYKLYLTAGNKNIEYKRFDEVIV